MSIKAIITGVTGMIGEGVLHECLQHKEVDSVLSIARRSSGYKHEKLREIIHSDFQNLDEIRDQLSGYNACYFCAGVSSVGKSEKEYNQLIYDLTLGFARTLAGLNPSMNFCYISGAGTDSSEKGRSMWARVKGKTENDLLKLPFASAYMFRPGYIQPTKGLKYTLRMYKFTAPLYPVWKLLFPNYVVTLKEIGLAMINSSLLGYDKKILECADIARLAQAR